MTDDDARSSDVLVVGAGFAGLQAARELAAAGRTVTVLEARDRVGGRSRRGELQGRVVDLGGQWLGAHQPRLRALAAEFGAVTCPQYDEGSTLLDVNGGLHAVGAAFPYVSRSTLLEVPWAGLLELAAAGYRWDRAGSGLPTGTPWEARRAREWDSQSLESWIRRNIRTTAGRRLARATASALLCADPAQVSMLFFLEVLRQGHGLEAMIGVDGGAQQDTFVDGIWQLSQRMADELGPRVVLEAPARSVDQDHDAVRVVTPRGTYTAKHLIMTAPPPLVARIAFSPALPVRRRALMERMPMGSVIKLFVAYRTPFWRHRGLNGSVISTERPLGVVLDQTPHDESIGMLVGLIEGDHAVELSSCGAQERRERVIGDLTHYFGDQAAEPLDYLDVDWVVDEWAHGGYAAHMPPGVMTAYGDTLREPSGRIHWAGTETATESVGYFEGALQSGARAASEVLAVLP